MTTVTQNAASQAEMSPERAMALLTEGNRRFREGRPEHRDLTQQVKATSGGQWPFAAVLGCIDSRASAELVFDAGIGDIFSARIAGNCVDEDVLGSLEFACKVAGSRLLVVMGHSACGAVKGACDDVKLGHLSALLAKVRPAVEDIAAEGREATSSDAAFVQDVAVRNVRLAVDALRGRSEILRDMEETGDIRIIGAMYDVGSGAVEWLDD